MTNNKKLGLGVPSQQDVIDALINFAMEAMGVAGQIQDAMEGLPGFGRKKRSILSKVLLPDVNRL